MQGTQAVALDLPLRLSIRQDEPERVRVGYRDLNAVGAEYGLKEKSAARATATGLDAPVARVVDVYGD